MKVQVRRYGYWFLVQAPVGITVVHLWLASDGSRQAPRQRPNHPPAEEAAEGD